jgi:V/A-type H+-transporting ATPase subunit C
LDEYSWASTVGRMKIRQNSLLRQADLAQVIDAKDLESALYVLRDTGYGRNLSELDNPEEFDQALEASLRRDYEFLESISPEPLILGLYRAKYDFHNLKVFAKSKYLDIPRNAGAMSLAGNFDPDVMEEIVDEWSQPVQLREDGEIIRPPKSRENLWGEVDELKEAFLNCRTIRDQVQSMKPSLGVLALLTDAALDRAYYAWSLKVLKKWGYEELIEIRKLEIDLINLRMAVRGKRQHIPSSICRFIMLTGGNLDHDDLVRSYDISFDEVAKLHRKTPWESLAREAVGLLERKESLTDWERKCDDALMEAIRKMKYAPLGPMSVVGYILGKETEVRNLRVILSGKQSEIPALEIRERLREAYV